MFFLGFGYMPKTFEEHFVDAVYCRILADNRDGLRNGLAWFAKDGPDDFKCLILCPGWGVVEDKLNSDFRVLVTDRLFRLYGTALNFLLVNLRRLLDLYLFDKAREDDTVHFNKLIFNINHSAPSLPLYRDGIGVVRHLLTAVSDSEVFDFLQQREKLL